MGSKVAALGCLAIVAGWTIGCSGKTSTVTSPTTATITAPLGPYILSGRVQEAGYFPVTDAHVEIIGGPMSGRVAVTNSSGDYIFDGVTGALQVRASKDGYVPATENISYNTQHMDFMLRYGAPPSVVGNVYRLTFTPSPSCQLPDAAKRRTYTATITSGGFDNRAIVTLTGAQFWTGSYCGPMNSFDALVHGSTVSLSNYGGDCGVIEQLGNTQYLSLWGGAEAVLTDSISTAAFVGNVAVFTSPNDMSPPNATCDAADHQLVFERIVAPSRR